MPTHKASSTAIAEASSRKSAISKRAKAAKKQQVNVAPRPPAVKRRLQQEAGLSGLLPAKKFKYKSTFELQENTEKKKKLEYQVTTDKNPPPGFTYVPVGNPELSRACKELSRERDYMIFIVSKFAEKRRNISEHVSRLGFHFRSSVVEEAYTSLGGTAVSDGEVPDLISTESDTIPESQDEYNKQVKAVLLDLFPRIPNPDLEQIIEHAFTKGNKFNGKYVVGLEPNLPLARKAQLAANAHIRHTHTNYDRLLQQTDWATARRLVEPVCLDVIMKWRGDEETGRDQLDEILREVVIIPDSDDEDEGDSDVEIIDSVMIESASEDELQVLDEAARSSPGPYNKLRRPATGMVNGNGASGAKHFPTRLHPDDPGYAEQQKKMQQQGPSATRQKKNRTKRSKQDREKNKRLKRLQAWKDADARQKSKQQNGMTSPTLSTTAAYNGQYPAFSGPDRYESPRAAMRRQLEMNPPQYAVPQSRHAHNMENQRHVLQNQAVTRELPHPIQTQQHPVDRPIVQSIEQTIASIDLTDSPARHRPSVQYLPANQSHMLPRRVMMAPPHNQQTILPIVRERELVYRPASQQRNDIVYVPSEGEATMRRRVYLDDDRLADNDQPVEVARDGPWEQVQRFSSSQVHVPDTRVDLSWIPLPRGSRNEPILITSSPHSSDPRPAIAPARRVARVETEPGRFAPRYVETSYGLEQRMGRVEPRETADASRPRPLEDTFINRADPVHRGESLSRAEHARGGHYSTHAPSRSIDGAVDISPIERNYTMPPPAQNAQPQLVKRYIDGEPTMVRIIRQAPEHEQPGHYSDEMRGVRQPTMMPVYRENEMRGARQQTMLPVYSQEEVRGVRQQTVLPVYSHEQIQQGQGRRLATMRPAYEVAHDMGYEQGGYR